MDESDKMNYRKFIINQLIKFTNKFNTLERDIQKAFHDEELAYKVLDIVIYSKDIEEKILASGLLGNLTYVSNDVTYSICDENIIPVFITLMEKNTNQEELLNNILTIIGNIMVINTEFILKQTDFIKFYTNYIHNDLLNFNSTRIWINNNIVDLIDCYVTDEKIEVN